MKAEELKVIDALADAWKAFQQLPDLHSSDEVDFMNAIHTAQRIVLARPQLRTFINALVVPPK